MMIVTLIAALAAAPAATDAPDTASDLAALQQLYDSSCGSRGYGAYDDVCDQISQQMREAERNLRRPAPAMGDAPSKPAPAAHATLPPDKPLSDAPATAPAGTPPAKGAASPPSKADASPPPQP